MKLKDILEKNFQSDIYAHDPSGLAPPTTVDPEKVRDMRIGKQDKENRAKRLRDRFKFIKNMRKPVSSGVKSQGDNEDLTGSGAHSVVNGPYNY